MNFKQGTFYLIIAWGILLLTGYVVNVWLARYFGPENYGVYGLVMSVLLWIEIVVINGLPYAVQKFVSSDESRSGAILWTAGKMQFIIAVVLFVVSFSVAPLIARFFRYPDLVIWFRIAFIDILAYGFFHLFAAYQNGLRQFGKQALLLVVYGLSKLGLIFLFISLTQTLAGAFLANVGASVAGLIIGLLFIGKRAVKGVYNKQQLIRFSFPSLMYFLMLNLLFYIDLWIVNYFLGKVTGGHYVAASLIARIPYFIVFGLSAAVLPTLSSNLRSGITDKVKSTIQSSFRFFLMMALPAGILISVFNRELIVFIYSSVYIQSGFILPVLVWGMVFLALFSILTTIINADNMPHISFGMALLTVLVDIICNVKLVPAYGVIGGAAATTLAVGTGTFISILYVVRRFHVLGNWKSFIRIGIAALVLTGTSKLLQGGPLHFIIVCLSGCFVYGLMLLVLRELSIRDFFTLLIPSEQA